MPVELTCENCDSSYSVKPSRSDSSRFCSMDCKSDYSRVSVVCTECGESFSKYKRRVNRSDEDFCSEECKEQYWSDNIAPELRTHGDTVEVSCNYCGSKFEKPKSTNKYNKTFCDKQCHGSWLSENVTGTEHPNWVEDSEDIYYGPNWYKQRDKALERDRECTRCGMSIEEHIEEYNQKPDVHHIKPIKSFEDKQEANNLSNLTVLCRSCHRKIESQKTDN